MLPLTIYGMRRRTFLRGAAVAPAACLAGCAAMQPLPATPADESPPPIPREFRAAWVATVDNIDWPSRRGLPVAAQKAELIAIVERARALNLNALIVQVRPAADALYASAIEPWSEYLSGIQGQAPEPYYDPLRMWIDEAHRRGIALHAWFNPYRARHTSASGPRATNHIANTHPAIVKDYGGTLWLDPGEETALRRTLDVVADVTRRYDIDGVHIDDYFYPYPAVRPGSEPPVDEDFPDDASWLRSAAHAAGAARADWRRDNVNRLVARMYASVRREKAWVRLGISPFGIGRSDRRPAGIEGFSQYDSLYADVETWMANGWFDYLAPQLYWPLAQTAQAFDVLLRYWLAQNPHRRHVWPGLFTSRIDATAQSWPPAEIIDQIAHVRATEMPQGHVHFSMRALTENRQGIGDRLRTEVYPMPALVPAADWIAAPQSAAPSVAPGIEVNAARREVLVTAPDAGRNDHWLCAVWARTDGTWRFQVRPAASAQVASGPGSQPVVFPYRDFDATRVPERIVAFIVDRFGNESRHARWTASSASLR